MVREAELAGLLDLREPVLTPGRLVTWWYDPSSPRTRDVCRGPACQHTGLGRQLLVIVVETVRTPGADLIWATARPSAVGSYACCGFEVGEELRIQPTNGLMHYVWAQLRR